MIATYVAHYFVNKIFIFLKYFVESDTIEKTDCRHTNLEGLETHYTQDL